MSAGDAPACLDALLRGLQEKEEQVTAALQQVTSSLRERSEAEQGFMERYVASLDDNQAQLEEQYIANAADYNTLKDRWGNPLWYSVLRRLVM